MSNKFYKINTAEQLTDSTSRSLNLQLKTKFTLPQDDFMSLNEETSALFVDSTLDAERTGIKL